MSSANQQQQQLAKAVAAASSSASKFTHMCIVSIGALFDAPLPANRHVILIEAMTGQMCPHSLVSFDEHSRFSAIVNPALSVIPPSPHNSSAHSPIKSPRAAPATAAAAAITVSPVVSEMYHGISQESITSKGKALKEIIEHFESWLQQQFSSVSLSSVLFIAHTFEVCK